MNTYLWILTWLRKRDHVARAPWGKRKSKQYMSRVVSFSIFRDARALSICAWHRRPRVTLKLQGPSHSQITTPELCQSPGSNLRQNWSFWETEKLQQRTWCMLRIYREDIKVLVKFQESKATSHKLFGSPNVFSHYHLISKTQYLISLIQRI